MVRGHPADVRDPPPPGKKVPLLVHVAPLKPKNQMHDQKLVLVVFLACKYLVGVRRYSPLINGKVLKRPTTLLLILAGVVKTDTVFFKRHVQKALHARVYAGV
jgi:hypothetical protein